MDGQLLNVTLILLTSPSWTMEPPRMPPVVPASSNINECVAVEEPGSVQHPAEWRDTPSSNQPGLEPAVPLPERDWDQEKPYRWRSITIAQTSQENVIGWTVQWNVAERLRVGVTFNYFGATNFVTLFCLEVVPSTARR